MFHATDKWCKLLCINYNIIDWSSLWNNSRFIDKILHTINQLLKYSHYIIHTTLLLESNGVVIFKFKIVWDLTLNYAIFRIKYLKDNVIFQPLLVSMYCRDIPISLALFGNRDLPRCALNKLMFTPAWDSSSLIHKETVSGAAGLCGFLQLIKGSFTSGFTTIFWISK